MALTSQQQSDLDYQNAVGVANAEREAAGETRRHANQLAIETDRENQLAAQQAKQAKLEAVRLAKEVLIENARSKSVDERDVTAADITAYAATLVAYVNA